MAAALALLAVVGLASTSDFDRDHALSTSELGVVVLVVAVAAALALGVGTVALGGGYGSFGGDRPKLIAALFIAALLAAVVALALWPADADITRQDGLRLPSRETVEGDGRSGSSGGTAALAAAIVAAVALLAGVLALVGARVAGRSRRRTELAADEGEAVIEAVDESLDDLRRERDVRRAIIACYARMERALEHAGSARRPAEAPFEFLIRVLERITANGRAARALTELFERAKFGAEPLGEREKRQAIGALELLRGEVRRPL